MGVVNVTPDSFYDGGFYFDPDKAMERGLELATEGADIIDIGGESTRPGSDPVAWEEELRRIMPILTCLRKNTGVLISVDTTKYPVARAALEAGADIINDISSFRQDPGLLELATQHDAGFILMHMKGTPKTMQDNPSYENVLGEVKSFLNDRLETARAHGLKKENIIVDPGIGFGKRLEDNLVLLNHLSFFEDLERPVLVGISRKSFIGKILNLPPQERLEGTIAASVLSVIRGAHLLRVHDVKAIRRAIQVAEAILNERRETSPTGEDKVHYVH